MIPHFELLSETAITTDFDCGEPELNGFLINSALLFQKRYFGVTILCYEDGSKNTLMGYYTLCPASVQRDTLPEKMFTGPRPNPIPGFRLCRLAVDKRFQANGWGKLIFIHALKKCLDQSNQIGGGVVIIDAKDEKAKKFYERFGFASLANSPLVLVQTIKFIQKHF
jgi:GNAT superfamily N-acetyltransferase